MQRYDRKPKPAGLRLLSRAAFVLFIIFVGYKILTPPSRIIEAESSPDGRITARLRSISYYADQPSYRIDYRREGKPVWLRLLNLPAYTNAPPETHDPDLQWSDNSERLDFFLAGTSVWHHVFPPEPQ